MTYEQAAEKSVGTLGVQWSARVVRQESAPAVSSITARLVVREPSESGNERRFTRYASRVLSTLLTNIFHNLFNR